MNAKPVQFLTLTLVLVAVFSSITYVYADTLFDNRVTRYKKQAADGDKYAQYKLGMVYLLGKTGKVDIEQAKKYFMESASKGYAKSEFRLGYIYYHNKDGSGQYAQAVKWLTRAANKNHGMAQYYLARMYYEGRGAAKNYDAAYAWAKKARAHSIRGAGAFLRQITATRGAEAKPKPKVVAKPVKKKPVKRVVRRYRSPRPKVARPPRGDVAFDTRKVLMSGAWLVDGHPANTLPSSIVSQCEQNARRIKCTSDRIKTVTENYTAHYQVISIYSDFTTKGTFSVKYKTNYVFVLPEDPDEPNPKFQMPKMGLQEKTTHLDCQIQGSSAIKCVDDKKNPVRFTK